MSEDIKKDYDMSEKDSCREPKGPHHGPHHEPHKEPHGPHHGPGKHKDHDKDKDKDKDCDKNKDKYCDKDKDDKCDKDHGKDKDNKCDKDHGKDKDNKCDKDHGKDKDNKCDKDHGKNKDDKCDKDHGKDKDKKCDKDHGKDKDDKCDKDHGKDKDNKCDKDHGKDKDNKCDKDHGKGKDNKCDKDHGKGKDNKCDKDHGKNKDKDCDKEDDKDRKKHEDCCCDIETLREILEIFEERDVKVDITTRTNHFGGFITKIYGDMAYVSKYCKGSITKVVPLCNIVRFVADLSGYCDSPNILSNVKDTIEYCINSSCNLNQCCCTDGIANTINTIKKFDKFESELCFRLDTTDTGERENGFEIDKIIKANQAVVFAIKGTDYYVFPTCGIDYIKMDSNKKY